MILQSTKPGSYIPLPLVWIAALALVGLGLGEFGILDNNEGLYAEIPREMLAAQDWRRWIIPHLNGLPYMEKPPLLYWLTALSFALFGQAEWAARMVPACSALGCVWLLTRFGAAVERPQAGRLAALIFISGVGVNVMSHVLMFDMLLTAMLTAALIWAYRFSVDRSARSVRAAYAFLALAVLAKGFVAIILFGLVVGAHLVFTRKSPTALREELRNWCEPWGLLIFLSIAVPWHLAASLVEPLFPWFYFINEHVLRFLGMREPHDYYAGPWWYYLPRMVIYLFPWSFLVPAMLFSTRPSASGDPRSLRAFLTAAWLAPLLFFSVSSAKANYYLIAVMPFAAFHLALALEERMPLPTWRRVLPGVLIAILAIAAAIALATRAETSQPVQIWGHSPLQAGVWFCAGLALLALGAAAWAWRRLGSAAGAYVLISAYVAVAIALVLPRIDALISTRELAEYINRELGGRRVFLYRNFEERSSLPFYLKRPLGVIESGSNDLFWGSRLKPGEPIVSREQFARIVQSERVAVVVIPARREEFKAEQFASRLAGEKKIGETILFFD